MGIIFIIERLILQLFYHPWIIIILILGAVALVLYMKFDDAHRYRTTKEAPLQGRVTPLGNGILYLLVKGASAPKEASQTLRGFASVQELYDYVYIKFGEAAFERIQIYRPGSDTPTEFVRCDDETDEGNRERLKALLN